MVSVVDAATEIVYLGSDEDAALWGADQANFFVPSLDREFAVLTNEPAMLHVLGELGLEDTPETRLDVAARIGRLVIEKKIGEGRIDPIAFVGMQIFDDDPSLLEALKQPAA